MGSSAAIVDRVGSSAVIVAEKKALAAPVAASDLRVHRACLCVVWVENIHLVTDVIGKQPATLRQRTCVNIKLI